MRRNLVIVRAGNASLHPAWLSADRNWDIIVNYFGDDSNIYRQNDVRRIDSKGPKWPALHALMGQIGPEIEAYDHVWFPDDDLACTPKAIDHFFALNQRYGLDLSQPALTADSHIGVGITVANRSFLLRYTNFVEIMAPCFSRAFLKRCLPSFNTSLSGWGLDFVWPKRAGDPRKVAIIDAVTVKHTRPHGGPNYAILKERGVDPEQEFADLLLKENIQKIHIIKGGITQDGQELTLWNGGHIELIHRILLGYLPEFTNFPDMLYGLIEPILQSLSDPEKPDGFENKPPHVT